MVDSCGEFGCMYELLDGDDCDDDNVCIFIDICQVGVCQGILFVCDDGVDCIFDICTVGICLNEVVVGVCLINNVCYFVVSIKLVLFCVVCVLELNFGEWMMLLDGEICDDGKVCI